MPILIFVLFIIVYQDPQSVPGHDDPRAFIGEVHRLNCSLQTYTENLK